VDLSQYKAMISV